MRSSILPVLLIVFLVLFPDSLPAQSSEQCMLCHGEPSLEIERGGKMLSLHVDPAEFARSAHADLDCAMCHEGFDPEAIPHASTIKRVDCLACHDGDDIASYTGSIHAGAGGGKKQAATCVDCHGKHNIRKIGDGESQSRILFAQQTCSRCHAGVARAYMASDHGKALDAKVQGAPACIDCHGEHSVISASTDTSLTSRSNQAALCLSCHLDKPEIRARMGPSAGFIASYERSVHGVAFREGNEAAATCTDCHGSHEMKKGSNPASTVAKKNISATCGTCHGDIAVVYDQSVHGKGVAGGVMASATCTDCHGEHQILSPKDANSPVSPKNVSAQVCSPCHGSVRLSEKYGLSSDRFTTFEDSYHGLAGRAGSVEVANCASCHGIHDILPSTDPASRVNKANLAATCGSCHPGANDNFTKGRVHVDATSGDDELLAFVASLYIGLIVVTVGGMFLHNLLDFIRKARTIFGVRRGLVTKRPVPHRLYLRMSLSERIQHGTLMVTFITLVITGFMLKFPDAWWVIPIRELSPAVFEIRSLLHRIAGVGMLAAAAYHLYYLFFVPRGKTLLRDLLPVRQDLTDPFRMIAFNLGFSKERPKFGRFSYIEKAEYWALVWGTVIMGVTGFILWFENTFIGLLGKLWWDVGLVVHYYEAWLATLAIIVWHFYFVIANPDVYPMNLAWWKGTISEEEMEEEHPLELEEIRQRERDEQDESPEEKT